MWSNEPVSDVSNDSPEFEPLVVERALFDRSTSSPHRRRRAPIVAAALGVAAVSVVVVAAVVAAIVADGDPADDSMNASVTATTAAATTTIEATADTGGSPSSAPPLATLAPVATTYPIGWSVVDVSEQLARFPPADPTDGWIDWSIPVPEPLTEMDPAVTLVASTEDGVLHRIEFPSGRISSRLLPPSGSTTGQIAVAGDSVAVPHVGAVVIIGGDGSLVDWSLETDAIPRVTSFGSRFLVTAEDGVDGPARQWILDRDGTATDITDGPFAQFPAWDQRFSPAGELVADDGNDIVVVGVDSGVRRIDRGRLVATGSHHYVVRTCDSVPCDYTVVELSTGQRTPSPLGVLDAYRFFDTSIRVSADGRFVQFADWRRDRPLLRIIDVSTGATIDAGELGHVRTPDAWASDSSGVFVAGADGVMFRSVDGRVALIGGLGPLRSVATEASD